MADWSASFKLPKFSDAAFEKAHDDYVKRNGYSVTVPAWDDIIQYKTFKPLTALEAKLWTGKIPSAEIPNVDMTPADVRDWINDGKGTPPTTRRPNDEEQAEYRANLKNQIPTERRNEIREEKQKKKERYIAMLASPSPKILRSVGAWAVSVDNAQDALSTLACVGMITAAVVGGTTAAVLASPVGWIAGAATLLNLINPMKYMKWPRGKLSASRAAKRDAEKFSDKNPFSKKARSKTTARIKNFRPGVANAVEALQVTQNIFGIGLSLGPIVGLIQDVVSGVARTIAGDKVVLKNAPDKLPMHAVTAQKVLKSMTVQHAFKWQSDATLETHGMMAANLALQVYTPYIQRCNPFDEIEDLEHVQIEAPQPTDPLTLEIISEAGHNVDDVCNWPQNGQKWITIGELYDATSSQATANLTHFAKKNPNSVEAFIGGQNAHDFALGTIEAIEGQGTVVHEYSVTERVVLMILDNGWEYPKNITARKIERFEAWVMSLEGSAQIPTAKDIYRYTSKNFGFTFV